MRLLSCAFAAVLVTATAALPAVATAQTPPSAPTPRSPEEAALQARAEAFGKSMETMSTEMQAAAAQTDKAKAKADLDALQARYQPEVDAFAAEIQTFAAAQGAPADEVAAGIEEIKSIPAMVRAEIEAAATAPAAPQ
ncbi:MAG: hypothetical protein A2352_01655 [Caulobacterales bacterium RIFOXYB1_FULL_67_16]|nr:MAG: hypothetical protein A2352_01655 [Caulobacterales bacterium RIFOXYB1_FULL_67_16]